MEFKVDREALVKELGIIRVAVEKKTTIPVLAFVLFDVSGGTLNITGTDCDVTIITSVEAKGDEGSFCVPAFQLFDLLRLLTENEVKFTLDKNERVKIECGRSRHSLPTLKADQFPAVDQTKEGEKISVPAETLRGMVKAAMLAISADPNEHRPHCISLQFFAKDGTLEINATTEKHFICTALAVPEKSSFDVLLPRRAAQVLIAFAESGNIEAEVSEAHAVFTANGRTFIARLGIGKFVEWRVIVPDVDGHKARIPIDQLRLALRRATVTSEEAQLIRAPLSCEFSKTSLTIESRETKSGKSVEPLDADCPSMNGDTQTRGVHGTQLLDFLNLVESDTVFWEIFPPKIQVKEDGTEKEWPRPMRFTPGVQGDFNLQYFTNPVRID